MHNITRRSALTAASAIVAAGAAAVPVLAAGPSDPTDPIYAAIKGYEAARQSWLGAYEREWELERTLPSDVRQWHGHAGDWSPPADCDDDPRWIESQISRGDTYVAYDNALVTLFTTEPTTLNGLAALFRVLAATEGGKPYPERDYPSEDPMLFMVVGEEPDGSAVRNAGLLFPNLVARALERIAARTMS